MVQEITILWPHAIGNNRGMYFLICYDGLWKQFLSVILCVWALSIVGWWAIWLARNLNGAYEYSMRYTWPDVPKMLGRNHQYTFFSTDKILASCFRAVIDNQLPYFYLQIPTQLAYHPCVKPGNAITAVFVEVCPWNVKVFADFIFTDALFFQYFIYA